MKTWTVTLLLCVLAGCGPGRWRPADPLRPNAMVCAVGTVQESRTLDNGDVAITLLPDPGSRRLLADGQTVLACEFRADRLDVFRPLFSKTRVGSRVEICGYYVVDAAAGDVHKIRPATSLDPYPE